MHQDDWALLKELFVDAVTQTGDDQARFVDDACRRHPVLADDLRQLVASYRDAGDFLEQPVLLVGADSTEVVDTAPLHPGDVVNDTYEVQSTLGEGGMGVVYRVLHRGLRRSFAAKVIHASVAADGGWLDRFEREAVALGRLKHPNIVDVTDYGVERGAVDRPYLIMECLEGATLADRLRSGPVPPDAAIDIFAAVASALDYAHAQGVLHLDLKPANVSMHQDGGGPLEVKILDFGLAHVESAEAGTERWHAPLAGTPAYLSPERLDGSVPGAAADIYAFGVLMYETLTGRAPFTGTVIEVLDQQRRSKPPLPSALNPNLHADLDRALIDILAKDPGARPRTAEAALSAVRAAMLAHNQRAWRRREIPRRALIATTLGLGLAASSPALSRWSPAHRLELLTVDARYAVAPSRSPSDRIVLLLLDDVSLAADPLPLVQRDDSFGRDLARVLDADARSAAVDFLLPASWSGSGPFTQLVLEHAERLTLAAYSSADGEIVGPECIAGTTTVALGPERAAALFGFINLDQDEDGVSRMARLAFRDTSGALRPSFAARAAQSLEDSAPAAHASDEEDRFWIDHRLDPTRFTRVSWKDLGQRLREQPELFRNRIVLAGADYAASGDEPRIPVRGRVPGVTLHALAVATMLEGFPIRAVGRGGLILLSAVVAGLLCVSTLLLSRPRAVMLTAAALLASTVASFVMFALNGLIVPLIVPIFLGFAGAVVGLAIAQKSSQYPRT